MITGWNKYGLKSLLSRFEIDDDLSHDASDDAFDLLEVVRAARPDGAGYDWYTQFLMTSYKPTSYFL